MPVELAGPVAFMSLVPAMGGKVAMPAFFKAGGVATGGLAGKAATFAGMKGVGAGKGLAAGKGGIFKETTKLVEEGGKKHHVDTETAKEEAAALFALLVGRDAAAEGLKDERQKAEKGRRVVLSSRGDRSRLYGEFL